MQLFIRVTLLSNAPTCCKKNRSENPARLPQESPTQWERIFENRVYVDGAMTSISNPSLIHWSETVHYSSMNNPWAKAIHNSHRDSFQGSFRTLSRLSALSQASAGCCWSLLSKGIRCLQLQIASCILDFSYQTLWLRNSE